MKLSPRARGVRHARHAGTRHFSGCTASQSLLVPLSYSGKVADALPRVDVGSVAHLSTTYNIQCTPGDSHLTAPSGDFQRQGDDAPVPLTKRCASTARLPQPQ
ncbi:hypothetical protein GQ600_12521 [Phytophthora cactorum]|nr:hypothetical protein GQ600_12521 [Phytophthora cactorum]